MEFLAVAMLTIVCMLGVAQFAVWVWARNIAVTAAHEGVRTAAEEGRPLGDGSLRTRQVLEDGLAGASRRFEVETEEQGTTVVVRARGFAPRIVPFLPAFEIDARASALDEDAVFNP
ncbi:MAG TPA: TadE family protein [Acidimicrobiia bacterium]